MVFGVLFFPKSCLNVGGAAYTRVFTVIVGENAGKQYVTMSLTAVIYHHIEDIKF